MNFVDYLIKDKKNLNKEIFINKNLRYSDLYDYIKSLKHLTKGKKIIFLLYVSKILKSF